MAEQLILKGTLEGHVRPSFLCWGASERCSKMPLLRAAAPVEAAPTLRLWTMS